MSATASGEGVLLEKLEALRTELADLAFDLEHKGRADAADVAATISNRVGELRAEVAGDTRHDGPPPGAGPGGREKAGRGSDGLARGRGPG